MEWSSDDEDVPPVVSLRLSGSTASPCFLVQDSQPSPKKQIAGPIAGGFLTGLSQVPENHGNDDGDDVVDIEMEKYRELKRLILKCRLWLVLAKTP